jgi:hypothetical protein
MKQRVFCLFIFFLSLSLKAQEVKKVDVTSQYWITYSGKFRISNQLELIAESTFRSKDHSINKLSQSLVLVGVSWSANDFIKLAIGYQHISIEPATSKITVAQPEYRPWQQIQFLNNLSSKKITQRLRLEERFRKVLLNDSTLASEIYFNFRFRYIVSAELPLSKKEGVLKPISLILSEEIFINVGKQVVYNYFDHNRISVGLKYKINEGNSFQLSYLNLFQQLPIDIKFRNLHIFRLIYNQNLDFRKGAKS